MTLKSTPALEQVYGDRVAEDMRRDLPPRAATRNHHRQHNFE
jgi:hypothetical protein